MFAIGRKKSNSIAMYILNKIVKILTMFMFFSCMHIQIKWSIFFSFRKL